MQLSILQLNTWGGTHFPAIEKFLKENDFDILCFQEITGKDAIAGNFHSKEDYFKKFQQLLSSTHNGEVAITQFFTSNPSTGYQANAIFYKKDLSLKANNTLWLNKREEPFPSDTTFHKEQGRNVLHVSLEKEGQMIEVICTHLVWSTTPHEEDYQREQNQKLIEYVKQLPTPWILCGDFNISPENESILDLEKLGHNLTKEYCVSNTIDATNHLSWKRIQPGFAVDYIFVSPEVKVESFQALENVHLSDHLGLTTVVSF